MIFTDQYIQMMKESPIQKEWKPKVGDWTWYHTKTEFAGPHLEILTENHLPMLDIVIEVIKRESIWLPTSDDWWEMIDLKENESLLFYRPIMNGKTIYGLQTLNEYAIENSFYGQSQLKLLSAFYHKQRWNLRWENSQWRK